MSAPVRPSVPWRSARAALGWSPDRPAARCRAVGRSCHFLQLIIGRTTVFQHVAFVEVGDRLLDRGGRAGSAQRVGGGLEALPASPAQVRGGGGGPGRAAPPPPPRT